MNINNKFHQCSQCKKTFPEKDVYRIGIKKKEFFCRECAKNIKSECMWCGKELAEKKWKRRYGYEIRSEEGKLAETIDRDNHRKWKHHKYYLICEEGREWGIRPNGSCGSRHNDWWVEKGNQKRQEKASKDWKECQGKAIYFKDPETGKVICDMKCWKLVPPGEKYCKDDSCIYFTAVYNGVNSEERKKIRQKWDQHSQEKYQKANEWWNSLSLTEKQTELKKEEEHLKNLGLQRQRCWIERLDKNSILFENGKIYYENMDKIPPSFLDRFGYPGFQWESVWKNNDNCSNSIQAAHTNIEKEIKNKETSLKQAKENGDNEMAVKLEQQIQELKSQQKNSSIVENPTKNNAIAYLIVGVAVVAVLGFVILLARTKQKNPKIK